MTNLRKQLFLGVIVGVLCLGAFVGTSSAQRRGGIHFNISIGSPYRGYTRYNRYPRVVYRPQVYYTPRSYYPAYYPSYNSGYYNTGYYNSGYYAPSYNTGYYYSARRHRSRDRCNYYDRRVRY